jgi:hypothetical protein
VTDRALTNAEIIAAIAELVVPTTRDAQRERTIVETTVEAVMFATADPTMSASEIARRLGRRKSVVVRAVAAVREAEATGYPAAALGAPAPRFPWRGNRLDGAEPDVADDEQEAA